MLKGFKCTEETKRKMSEAHKGHPNKGTFIKGHKMSKEIRRKISKTLKGQIPWIKGKHHSEETKKRMSENRKGKRIGKNNPNWKSDNIKKSAIHMWIRNNYGNANHCELCNRNRKLFNWANLNNHKYKRDIQDYIQLCNSCHINLDKGNIVIEIVRELRKEVIYPKKWIE